MSERARCTEQEERGIQEGNVDHVRNIQKEEREGDEKEGN